LGHTYDETGLLSIDQLIAGFSIARLHRAPARFDAQQLMHWQREAVQHAPADTLWQWLGERVATLVPATHRTGFLTAVRGNISFPRDAEHWAEVLFTDSVVPTHVANETIRAAGSRFFEQARALFAAPADDFAVTAQALAKATGCRGKALYQPLRAALTGELDGPELARLLPLLGPARTAARLTRAAERAA
jgi:nondiscriminating glutamyl-tRNA synthetase